MNNSIPDTELALDRQLCFAVYGAAHALNRTYKRLLDPLGLTYPQYLVMLALWQQDGLSVKALGEQLGLDSGTLSPLLKRLQQSGHVGRRRDDTDERKVLISLTESGAALKQHASGVMLSLVNATGCTVPEMIDLRDRLQVLRDNLLENAAD